MNADLNTMVFTELKGMFREVEKPETFWALVDLQPSGRWGAYCRNVNLGETVYGRPFSCDYAFAWSNGHPFGLAVKVSYQATSGSVDEKFPYWINNLKGIAIPSILVLDGPGQRPDAVKWAKKQVDEKLLMVCTIQEFQAYMRRRF